MIRMDKEMFETAAREKNSKRYDEDKNFQRKICVISEIFETSGQR